jgi:hypothetical protein
MAGDGQVALPMRTSQATWRRRREQQRRHLAAIRSIEPARLSTAFQALCAALSDHDNRDDAMTSVRLNGRYKEPGLGLKEHTMGQVIANASNTCHRR